MQSLSQQSHHVSIGGNISTLVTFDVASNTVLTQMSALMGIFQPLSSTWVRHSPYDARCRVWCDSRALNAKVEAQAPDIPVSGGEGIDFWDTNRHCMSGVWRSPLPGQEPKKSVALMSAIDALGPEWVV